MTVRPTSPTSRLGDCRRFHRKIEGSNTQWTAQLPSHSGRFRVSATANPILSASAVTDTSATLTLSGDHVGDWHYKANAAPYTGCSSAVSSGTTTATLTNLTAGESYTFKAYSDGSCSNEITATATDADFTTLTLASSNVTDTTATLTISGHTAAWRYKYTTPTGGTCSDEIPAGTSTADVMGLTLTSPTPSWRTATAVAQRQSPPPPPSPRSSSPRPTSPPPARR